MRVVPEECAANDVVCNNYHTFSLSAYHMLPSTVRLDRQSGPFLLNFKWHIMYNPDLLLILVENLVFSLNTHYQLTWRFDPKQSDWLLQNSCNLIQRFHQTHILKIRGGVRETNLAIYIPVGRTVEEDETARTGATWSQIFSWSSDKSMIGNNNVSDLDFCRHVKAIG